MICILMVLQEMPFFVLIFFVFYCFQASYFFCKNRTTLTSDMNLIFNCVFYLQYPNQQKNQFCPNVRYDLVEFTQWFVSHAHHMSITCTPNVHHIGDHKKSPTFCNILFMDTFVGRRASWFNPAFISISCLSSLACGGEKKENKSNTCIPIN